ncbi:MAG: WG repeat-containing protein [Prevotella sp.]|nr:WG repeat-containing protein [Prevotella sp.]
MKKVFLSLLFSFFLSLCYAQVAKWAVPAEYDSISPCIDNNFYLVEKGGKYGIMNPGPFSNRDEMEKEREVLSVDYDSIAPFRNGYAVVFDTRNNIVKGVLKEKSDSRKRFVDMSQMKYKINSGFPYVSEGYLLVLWNNNWYFINVEKFETNSTPDSKHFTFGPYYEARPYFYGFASVRDFEDFDKLKPGRIGYINTDGEWKDIPTMTDVDKVNFVSSFSKGKSLISYNKRYFIYYLKEDSVAPLFYTNKKNKIEQVRAEEKEVYTDLASNKKEYVVFLKNEGSLLFDQYMRLKSTLLPFEDTVRYEIDEYVVPRYMTKLKTTLSRNAKPYKYGLEFLYTNDEGEYKYNELLPPQFDEVRIVREDEAIVKLNGRYGVIKADSIKYFDITLAPVKLEEQFEKEEGFVEYAHNRLMTGIKIRTPWEIPNGQGDGATVVVPVSEGCEIPVGDLKTFSNNQNYGYDGICVLYVPKDLSPDLVRTHVYNFYVRYQGLRSANIEVPVVECYSPTFAIEKIEGMADKYSAPDSILTVNFGIFQRDENRGLVYPKTVTVSTSDNYLIYNSTPEENNGIYTTMIERVGSGQNVPFTVEVSEDNCPPVTMTFYAKAEIKEAKKELTEEEKVEKVVKQKVESRRRQIESHRKKEIARVSQVKKAKEDDIWVRLINKKKKREGYFN